jgi:hypothetical protein
MLYLPRLAVFVRIEADRPGTWFPGPLGPYLKLGFPPSSLVGTLNMRKCRETPRKLLFVLASFGGHNQKKTIFANRQPNHVKHLLSGLYDVLKYNFHSIRLPPGDPRVAY